MGFFNKLFGGANEKVAEIPKNQRAQFKDAKHFEAMLKKKDGRIEMLNQSNENLAKEGKLEPFHYWSIAMMNLDKVYVAYSMGRPIEECYELFIEATKWYVKGWDPGAPYADLVDTVSLAYLLQVPDIQFDGIVNYVQQADAGSDQPEWKPDGILWFIINARKQNTMPQPDTVIWPMLYQDLFAITKMSKSLAEIAMKTYLNKWYGLHRQDPWYDNHKKDLVYKGYWSWEAGAITKIMQLDDSSFKDNPYYPYDLVHWNKT